MADSETKPVDEVMAGDDETNEEVVEHRHRIQQHS